MSVPVEIRKRHSREYETIYILESQATADTATKIASRMAEIVEREGGKLLKLDHWGKRRLAYKVKKNTKGYFFYVNYLGFTDVATEMERNLKMFEQVIRFQSVMVKDDIDPSTREVKPEDIVFDPKTFIEAEIEPEPVAPVFAAAAEDTAGEDFEEESEDEEAGGPEESGVPEGAEEPTEPTDDEKE